MHTKAQKMYDVTKARVAGLILGALLAITGGMVGAVTFSTNGTPCTGSVTLTAPGQVSCGGTTTSCVGQQTIVIDAQGKINCVTSAPTAPTNVTATGGNTQAIVTFTASASDGGAAISGYTVTSSPTGGTDSNAGSTALSHIVTGLTNGTAYTFTVTAANSAGNSAASAPSSLVTPGISKNQTIGPISFSPTTLAVLGTTTVSATATSGLAVSFSSTTPSVCTVTGSAVRGIASGICTIAADQAGNASYSAATQVTQSITIGTAVPVSTKPSCTLAESFLSVTAGYIRLVASCAPDATSYEWSANTGCGTTTAPASGCLFTAPTASTTYTVTGINAAGRGNIATLPITVTPLTPICTIAPAASVIDLGGSSTLTASCNPAATAGHTWTGGTCAGKTINTCTVTPTAIGKTTYTVAGTNSVGIGATASATVEVATPTCTLTAAPLSIVPGESSILTANCSPTPTATGGYTWTGGSCAGNTTNTCTVAPATLGAAIYTVQGTNAAGQGSAASATVTVVPLTTPSCTLTSSSPSVVPGGSSTLTASCSPTATAGYTWTGGACAGVTTNTCNTGALTAVGSTPYTVQGINSAGTGSAASATVTVATDPGCPNGYTYSTVQVTWPSQAIFTGPQQTIHHCEVKAYRFTMGVHDRLWSGAMYTNSPATYVSLSQTPYDFSPGLEAQSCATGGAEPGIQNSSTGFPYSCQVTAGATYYLNVRSSSTYNGPDVCQGSCTFRLVW